MMTGVSSLEALVVVARRHGVSLTVDKILSDNQLSSETISTEGLVICAANAGLLAKPVRLSWSGLAALKNALPVIVTLKNGSSFVLLGTHGSDENPVAILRDPKGGAGAVLKIDRPRFEDAWTGEVILVKREYAASDEEQPFSLRLVVALILEERWLVRDLVLAALVLGLISLAPILFWRIMADRVLYDHAFSTFTVLCIGMAILALIEGLLSFLRAYLVLVMTTRVDVRLSEYVYDRLLKLPIDFFERTQVGLIARDLSEVFKVRTFLTGQLFGTILDSLTFVFLLPLLFLFSVSLTLILLGVCGVIVLWLVVMLPFYQRANRLVQAAEGQRGAFLYQTLAGMRTVKSLALESRQRRGWDVHIAKIAKLRTQEGFIAAVTQGVTRPLERLAVVGTFALGVYFALVSKDPVFVGMLFAYLMLSMRVAQPLMQLAQLVNQYDEARNAVGTVEALVNRPKEVGLDDDGVTSPITGRIVFSGVTFKYAGAMSPALIDVSIEIPEGTTLGVVGRSGSGKTTVTRLLQGLHADYSGLIKIDGMDLRQYNLTHLRRSLGVVLQENFLFSGTIRENISAGRTQATFDEVVGAARLAGAEEFIDRLPYGYETHIYEGSPNLSGGQRQRLAIARALILDPRVLILDEATSALDPDSESIVNANIKRIARGRTVIIVSHRLSSLVNADRILVLERGRVLDIGPHQDLLERCEIYTGLWRQQHPHAVAAAASVRPRSVPHAG